jgi:hypothetical protein
MVPFSSSFIIYIPAPGLTAGTHTMSSFATNYWAS